MRARPIRSDNREISIQSENRDLPQPSIAPTIFISVPGNRILLGDRVYPFSSLYIDPTSTILNAKWRRLDVTPYRSSPLGSDNRKTPLQSQNRNLPQPNDGGVYTSIELGSFTDLLSAIRFTSEAVNIFGIFSYELIITNTRNQVQVVFTTIQVKITTGIPKASGINENYRPFSDSQIATDETQIGTIKYSVGGDVTVAKTSITRPILYSGTHDGSNNAATLSDSGTDFTGLIIRLNKDIVRNVTDGSEGIITSITTTTVVAILAGGTDDDWDSSDVYEIVDGENLDIIARGFEVSQSSAGIYILTLFVEDIASTPNESSEAIIVRIDE